VGASQNSATAWRTFLQAHWPALVAADFFTTEVWTARGLVTYDTAFVIELHTRRVCMLGSTPNPDGAFVVQAVRGLLGESDAILREGRILLCDRDPNWTSAMEAVLSTVGVRVVRTPPASPNRNAHAERFVQSIKEECLNRVVPLGEWHLRRLVRELVAHYHLERNHQGIGNTLIDCPRAPLAVGSIRRRQRLGGLLRYYCRAA